MLAVSLGSLHADLGRRHLLLLLPSASMFALSLFVGSSGDRELCRFRRSRFAVTKTVQHHFETFAVKKFRCNDRLSTALQDRDLASTQNVPRTPACTISYTSHRKDGRLDYNFRVGSPCGFAAVPPGRSAPACRYPLPLLLVFLQCNASASRQSSLRHRLPNHGVRAKLAQPRSNDIMVVRNQNPHKLSSLKAL